MEKATARNSWNPTASAAGRGEGSLSLARQILDDNLHWCGKDRAWLERTAEANTLLVEEILLLIGNDTEDYFLLKKQPRRPAGKEKP